jgi:hypothetical protein
MKDLFDFPELHPTNLRKVLWSYGCPQDYDGCDVLIQRLNLIGYTCEYGLDASPYNLQRIQSPKKYSYEDMAHMAFALHSL